MKLTESTKVITKPELMDKVVKSANDDAHNDEMLKDDLQADIELLARVYNSKSKKFVAITKFEYIPLNDYLNHYHVDFDGEGMEDGTYFDKDNILVVDL